MERILHSLLVGAFEFCNQTQHYLELCNGEIESWNMDSQNVVTGDDSSIALHVPSLIWVKVTKWANFSLEEN